MDPRSLFAPTLIVFFLLTATIGVLCYGIPDSRQNAMSDLDWDDRAAVKAAFEQELGHAMYEEFIYKAIVGGGFCLIVFWPFSTAKPSFLVRLILLSFCGFAAAILSGNALAAQGALVRTCILGALLIGGMFVLRLFHRIAPVDSKEPLCFRWAPRHRVLSEVDDPQTLEKLERLRAISEEPPPVLS